MKESDRDRRAREFAKAQENPKFQGWLKYQEAAYEIGEGFEDDYDFSALPFDVEGLRTAEEWALDLWNSPESAYSGERNLRMSQSLTYFVGEVYIRSFEGSWVNARTGGKERSGWAHMVTLPFLDIFIDPNEQIIIALERRTREEWSWVYGRMENRYREWVAAGRPPRPE